MAVSGIRYQFSDYLTSFFATVLIASVISGSLTQSLDHNTPEAKNQTYSLTRLDRNPAAQSLDHNTLEKRNLTYSVRRIKRNPTPQKGYFFPIATYSVKHHKPAPDRGRDVYPETWEYRGQYFYGYRPRKTSSRKKTARLLAAGLPLLLAPLLSIIFSFPVLVPVASMTSQTSTLFNPLMGRRKKKKKRKRRNALEFDEERERRMKDIQAVANYLHEVDYNEHQQSRVMVNYLQCNGLLSPEDHCLERLCCEFGDPANRDAPELEKTVTSILIGHILNNEFIPRPFKRRLKLAAQFGRRNSGRCSKFYCPYVDDNWDYTSVYPHAPGTLGKLP